MSINNTWDASTDNDANTASNWDQNRVPTTGDIAVFDSATTSANCNLSGNISCDGIAFANAYAGTIDAVTSDVTLGTAGLVCTNGGSATIDMGTGSTWTCSGPWNHKDIGTLTYGTSTVVMDTDGTVITGADGKDLYNLTISANVTLSSATTTRQRVKNAATIASGKTFTLSDELYLDNSDITVNGEVAGTATLRFLHSVITIAATGTVSVSTVTGSYLTITNSGGTWSATSSTVNYDTALDGGTYGGTCLFRHAAGGTHYFRADGDITFTGAVEFRADSSGQTYTINNSGNHAIDFKGDVDFTETTGTLDYSGGTGTLTLSGTNNQIITTPSGWIDVVDAIVINKTAGDVTGPANGLYATSFTGTSTGTGTFDPNGGIYDFTGNCSWAAAFHFASAADTMNGSDWQIDGNFTADGQTLNATAGWDLDVTGTAVASGAGDVEYSTAGGTTITATSWNDGGNNTNWDFGGAVAEQSILCLTGVGA